MNENSTRLICNTENYWRVIYACVTAVYRLEILPTVFVHICSSVFHEIFCFFPLKSSKICTIHKVTSVVLHLLYITNVVDYRIYDYCSKQREKVRIVKCSKMRKIRDLCAAHLIISFVAQLPSSRGETERI